MRYDAGVNLNIRRRVSSTLRLIKKDKAETLLPVISQSFGFLINNPKFQTRKTHGFPALSRQLMPEREK
jgi:hypothetical protein